MYRFPRLAKTATVDKGIEEETLICNGTSIFSLADSANIFWKVVWSARPPIRWPSAT